MLGRTFKTAGNHCRAAFVQLQQTRSLNVHEYQVRFVAFASTADTSAAAGLKHLILAAQGFTWIPGGAVTLCSDHTICLQGAELMSDFGINVAPGIAIKSLDEVEGAAKKMADKDGQVCGPIQLLCVSCSHSLPSLSGPCNLSSASTTSLIYSGRNRPSEPWMFIQLCPLKLEAAAGGGGGGG